MIGPIPGMKRIQLYRQDGSAFTVIAGFPDERQAAEFSQWLISLAEQLSRLGLTEIPEQEGGG